MSESGISQKGAVSTLLADDLTQYEIGDEEYYVRQAENGPELYRRVGETVLPRVMANHDAVLLGGSFRDVVYDGMLFGVFHPFGGKMGNLTARDTDEHAVLLERVKPNNGLVEVKGGRDV